MMKSRGFGKRITMSPYARYSRDKWQGGWQRQSLPERPHFVKVSSKRTFQFVFSPICLRQILKARDRWRRVDVMARRDWLKYYGFHQKLSNAARATQIKRKVRNR